MALRPRSPRPTQRRVLEVPSSGRVGEAKATGSQAPRTRPKVGCRAGRPAPRHAPRPHLDPSLPSAPSSPGPTAAFSLRALSSRRPCLPTKQKQEELCETTLTRPAARWAGGEANRRQSGDVLPPATAAMPSSARTLKTQLLPWARGTFKGPRRRPGLRQCPGAGPGVSLPSASGRSAPPSGGRRRSSLRLLDAVLPLHYHKCLLPLGCWRSTPSLRVPRPAPRCALSLCPVLSPHTSPTAPEAGGLMESPG